ncbi:MAG: helix-hairpin-helix domain-containing protein [Thermoanaerobaculales bacterium]|jgi:competence protein ComEA|nr:helix-hairpin-helix domain-containing protein [Thermoanaerobaculales bacterium]
MNVRTTIAVLALIVIASSFATAAESASAGVVNINTASVDQLQLLPRVGPALAQRIVDFRETNGPFGSIDELVAVKGIGEKSLESLEPYLATNGATTLATKVKLPRPKTAGAPAAG